MKGPKPLIEQRILGLWGQALGKEASSPLLATTIAASWVQVSRKVTPTPALCAQPAAGTPTHSDGVHFGLAQVPADRGWSERQLLGVKGD